MPRTKEQNEKLKIARSNDILAASLNLFAAVGYHNVCVDLITETVNCSHGLFYHYFDSKSDIFAKLINGASDFDFEPLDLKAIANGKGYDGIKAIANYFGSDKVLNEAFICYAKIFLQDGSNKTVAAFIKKETGCKNVLDFIANLITKGQDSGDVINGDPVEIAGFVKTALLGYINSIIATKRRDRKPVDSKILLGFISKKSVN